MVYRIFVEKKKEMANEARGLLADLQGLLGITALTDLRVLNRYDVENVDKALFDYARFTVFAEPQSDIVTEALSADGATVFAVEYLPGQFDQRADSAAQCLQIIAKGERPTVRTAKVYVLYGALSDKEIAEIKKYVINPVEAREASLETVETLQVNYELPTEVAVLNGFISLSREALADFVKSYGLAMDLDDILFCQAYFKEEGRDPSLTEIRMIDKERTVWYPYKGLIWASILWRNIAWGTEPENQPKM